MGNTQLQLKPIQNEEQSPSCSPALLVLLAISAVMADQEESGVSEDLAETLRVARSPEARKRRRGRKGKRKNKGKGKGRKAKGKKGKMGNRRRRKNKQKN